MKFGLSQRTISLIFLLSATYLIILCVFLNFVHLMSAPLIGIIFVCYISWKKGATAGIFLTILNHLGNSVAFHFIAPEFLTSYYSALISFVVHIAISFLLGYFGRLSISLREEIERRKEVEKSLRELQNELEARVEKRTDELKKANDLLFQARKMEAIGQLSGTIAHDFNNFLNIILGYSTILADTLDKETPSYRYAQNIENAARTAAEMTSQLLTFARKKEFSTGPVDLNLLIKEMMPLLVGMIKDGITVKHVIEPLLPVIQGGIDLIKSAILNLCLNARDAMKNGGLLTLTTRTTVVTTEFCRIHGISCPEGVYSSVAVSDTGTGIDERVKSRLFEPFFTTKEEGKGTGMGLAAVYGIMRSHQGAVYAESKTGKGTTFFMLFPAEVRGS